MLAGLEAAQAVGLGPIKINAVLLRGINDTEIVPLVDWAVTHGYEMRFIEDMPLDGDRSWTETQSCRPARSAPHSRTCSTGRRSPRRGAAPAERWEVRRRGDRSHPGAGHVGIISSVTEPFCAACTRTRVTADGRIRSCLFSHEETDLLTRRSATARATRTSLRSGGMPCGASPARTAPTASAWRAPISSSRSAR